MYVSPIKNNQNFEGQVIVKNKISANQRYLFNLHRSALEEMIKGLPFDLFVEQSKSKKTITISTNVENACSYIVRKNKQDFEEAAKYAISDAKQKSKKYQDMIKAQSMLDASTNVFKSILMGDFKHAREFEKEYAKLATADFEVYKQLPYLVLNGAPKEIIKKERTNRFKYRIYRFFTRKTPEEKQFLKMRKEYSKELKAKNIQPKTVVLELPRFY